MKTVVILAFEGAHLLDVAGPTSVFADTASVVGRSAYQVIIGSEAGGTVRTHSGVGLATVTLDDLPASPDIVLIPGGVSGDTLIPIIKARAVRRWLAANKPGRLASVCSGAFVLAAWGYLDGRTATTHWIATSRLAEAYPSIRVDPKALFVTDGNTWTSAGVSTGIDMALAMVAEDFGRDVSIRVARHLVLQAHRPGHQSQFSDILTGQGGPYRDLVEWIDSNLDADLGVDALAERAGQSVRTFHRRFTAACGSTPAAFIQRLRVERARLLLDGGLPLKSVAARAGFVAPDQLRRAFVSVLGLSPAEYRLMHAVGVQGPPKSV